MPTERPLTAVRLAPGPALLAALDRALDGGPALAPLPVDLPEAEVASLLETLRPATLVDDAGERALPGARPVAGETAVVVATSGSTGRPRGVELSARALTASASASLRALDAGPDDRWLCCVPTHHVAGIQVLVRSRLTGLEPVVHERFSVEAVAAETRVTMVSLVPTMLGRLLDAGADLSHLRTVLLGGAAPSPALLARARAAGVRVVVSYGMTETSGGCVYDGRALDGVEVDVAADGHIRIRGPVLFTRYRDGGGPAGEWFVTPDLGAEDGQGRLEVLGRADDVIVTGGENVAAARVAALLEEHPAVAEAAVAGAADQEWGQRVVALVVARGAAPSLAELRDHVTSRAPASHAPRELVVVDALPRLASGKVAGGGALLAAAASGHRSDE